ncbi:MAG: hypothetical protein U9R15_17010, partial [Chloroflexota bacterium]|nr:hypothetical protein [Chloroflexota bacterium]
DFYDLYSQGRLDNGEHTEDFALWAAFYEIKQDREKDLQQISRERVLRLCEQSDQTPIYIAPQEPVLEIASA